MGEENTSDPIEGEGEAQADKGDATPKTVPLAALEDERGKRQALEVQVANLSGQVEQINKTPAAPQAPQKTLSRTELRALVDDGRITQDEADNITEKQLRETITKDVTETVMTRAAETRRVDKINSEYGVYTVALPNVLVPGSEERNKVEKEFQGLVELGQPNSKVTEVLAMRSVFGPVEALTKPKDTRETHEETLGGSPPDPGTRTDGIPKGLSQREREYYSDQINKGLYPDWKAVTAELEHADPGLRKRMGARA